MNLFLMTVWRRRILMLLFICSLCAAIPLAAQAETAAAGVLLRDCEVQALATLPSGSTLPVSIHLKRGDLFRIKAVSREGAVLDVAFGEATALVPANDIQIVNNVPVPDGQVEQIKLDYRRTQERVISEMTTRLSEIARRQNQALDTRQIEQLNLRDIHRDMNGRIIFGIAADGVTVGPNSGGSPVAMGQDIKRSFAQELKLEQSGRLPSRQRGIFTPPTRSLPAGEIEDLRFQAHQADSDAQMAESRARNELENLETRLSSAHGEPLSSSERAFYQNGLGNEVHHLRDSSLENRLQDVMRKDDEARREQDYEYNKHATDKFDTRP